MKTLPITLPIKLFLTFLVSVAGLNLSAADFDPFTGPKPIAIFIQTDPWAMVMGADNPRVAVYEDGTAIFLKKTGDDATYYRKVLSAAEMSDFKKRLTPVAELKDLKRSYNILPHVTDQPSAVFYIRAGDHDVTTEVNGLKATGPKRSAYMVLGKDGKPEPVPPAIIELHTYLSTIDFSGAEPWQPQYLEVMIWPFDYAKEVSVIWPKDWPGLNSARTIKRRDSYSIFLDGKMRAELQNLLSKRKETGAVEIGGKKWAVEFRSVFPGEPVWRKALEKEK